ncbi:hypothetical protein [Cognataquiflexum rubidum]|uniref:hypothetical protein n=1 Tax=Cognataquiflexum rubidum TaxID=2922273 RepID=UPI001F14452D|nr:hypothetical protein [Cognataquiflexum rubidum]MCH6234059.1 hypothetical protein [Cognataquiflexum rubidum]
MGKVLRDTLYQHLSLCTAAHGLEVGVLVISVMGFFRMRIFNTEMVGKIPREMWEGWKSGRREEGKVGSMGY